MSNEQAVKETSANEKVGATVVWLCLLIVALVVNYVNYVVNDNMADWLTHLVFAFVLLGVISESIILGKKLGNRLDKTLIEIPSRKNKAS